MPATTWISTADTHDWADPASWSSGIPGFSDTAVFNTSSVYVVTSSGVVAVGTLEASDSSATIDISAGTFTVENSSFWDGTFDLSGGTLAVQSGTLSLQGASTTIDAPVIGGGVLNINSGAVLLEFDDFAIGTLGISNAGIHAAADGTYNGTFSLYNSTLDTACHVITLIGRDAVSYGTLTGGGTIAITGTTDLYDPTIANNTELLDEGLITEDNSITGGTNSTDRSTIDILLGASYDIVNNSNIYQNGTLSIFNAGLFEKTGDTGMSVIEGNVLSTGTIAAASGTLQFQYGSDNFSNLVTGAGVLAVGYASQVTLAAAAVVNVATLYVQYNGDLVLGGDRLYGGVYIGDGSGYLNTRGHTLTLSGGHDRVETYILGGGTVDLTGTADVYGFALTGSGTTLRDDGLVIQDNVVTGGTVGTDSTTIIISSGATWDIANDNAINENGALTITNAGLFEKTAGTGTSLINASFTNTGTIRADNGNIGLANGVSTLAGTITGAGQFFLYSNATATIEASSVVDVAVFGIQSNSDLILDRDWTYDGFFYSSGSPTLDTQGHALTLTGSGGGLSGTLTGGGTVVNTGFMFTNYNNYLYLSGVGTELLVQGTAEQTSYVQLGITSGDNTTLDIAQHATYRILYDNTIGGAGTATIINAGLLQKLTTSGTSDIDGSFANTSTGTLDIEHGTLRLYGHDMLGGTVEGAGLLYVGSGSTVEIAATTDVSVTSIHIQGGGTLQIDGDRTYDGFFGTDGGGYLALNGHTLTLTNESDYINCYLLGPGTLKVTGRVDTGGMYTVGTGVVIVDAGTLVNDNYSQLGVSGTDDATLDILAGAALVFSNDSGIANPGTATIINAGLIDKEGYFGQSYINGNLTNTSTGTIEIERGYLQLDGHDTLGGLVTGAGELYLGNGNSGTYTAAAGLKVDVAILGVQSSATLRLGADFKYDHLFSAEGSAVIDLNGHVLTLTGTNSTVISYLLGPGTLDITGTANVSAIALTGVGTKLLIDGMAIDASGSTRVGNGPSDDTTLEISAAGTYDLVADAGLGANGTAEIINAGLFEKTDTRGQSTVYPSFNSTGTILVAGGLLDFVNSGTLGGTITGAGALGLDSGTHVLSSGVVVNVANLHLYSSADLVLGGDVTYARRFVADGGTTIDLNAHTLRLTDANGIDIDGHVYGPGTLVVTGTYDASGLDLANGAVLRDQGVITQTYDNQFGNSGTDTATLDIVSGATYDIQTNNQIGSSGTTVINNAGLFEKTANIGVSNIYVPIVNAASGTILANLGQLQLQTGLTNDGVAIAKSYLYVAGGVAADAAQTGTFEILTGGTAELRGTVTPDQTVTFAGSAGRLVLDSPTLFAGTITGFGADDTIDLGGLRANSLSLAGNALTLFYQTDAGTIGAVATLQLTGIADASSLDLFLDSAGNGTDIVFGQPGNSISFPNETISNDSWTGGAADGQWTSSANWGGGLPTAANNTYLQLSGAVTFDTTATVNYLYTGGSQPLVLTGGHLVDNNGGQINAGLTITGGTFEAVNGYGVYNGFTLAAGADAAERCG